ncbi:tRNA 5-carboxymethoxyuridine methyltransferase [Pleomorphomonas sp. T1.2MG-36]|uniref:class I SAM-dependent methyltransferase n=1 Tax=Pleomorphomonas sp. T1.2MG-36 TaxID=3041167 RepID=UPI002477B48C|nr:class I SAM-dependent methyltransferase [Pleomorphomonas sp. T1.2MG-36]CAI9408838.1 tRNA 5-carboxymethoxyuridine methyltransferase [Pleomorphomonas sp. T1.2MG-36]
MPSWDEEFSKPGYRYGTEPNGFLVETAQRLPKGARIIAAGDGEGRNGVWLASQGHRVLALDASAVGLAKARALAEERGVSLETAVVDLSAYVPEAETADAVVLIYVHMPPAIRRAAHRNLIRALKPDGLIILEAFHRDQLGRSSGGPRDIALLFDLALLAEDFGPDVRAIHSFEGEVELDEGRGHVGRGAIVRFVGAKV